MQKLDMIIDIKSHLVIYNKIFSEYKLCKKKFYFEI